MGKSSDTGYIFADDGGDEKVVVRPCCEMIALKLRRALRGLSLEPRLLSSHAVRGSTPLFFA